MHKILYRTEMSMKPNRNAVDVMLFEICELTNTDILEYISENYKLPQLLKRNINETIESIKNYDFEEDEIKYLLEEIISCIEDIVGFKPKYALWLASEEAVRECYEGNEQDIYVYDIDMGNCVILSDLDYDGILLGFEKLPIPIDVITN